MFQQFRMELTRKHGKSIPSDLGTEFCSRTYHVLKWTNISTFNTRAIVLYITLLIGMPWIYFVFEIVVMNIIFIYMKSSHEKVCRDMTGKI